VHHVGILYDQFMMHGQRNIKLCLAVFSIRQQNFANRIHENYSKKIIKFCNWSIRATLVL